MGATEHSVRGSPAGFSRARPDGKRYHEHRRRNLTAIDLIDGLQDPRTCNPIGSALAKDKVAGWVLLR